MSYTIRPARTEDVPALEQLIVDSARALSAEIYSQEEIDTAVEHVFGVDSELVADESYFVVTDNGEPAACGGWSRRKTLFGSDRYAGRQSGYLNPKTDAAKIRAFFVHPAYARKGIGRLLLQHCEQEARRHGFNKAEMMATLPGIRLYEACGYQVVKPELYHAPNGKTVRFVQMLKDL